MYMYMYMYFEVSTSGTRTQSNLFLQKQFALLINPRRSLKKIENKKKYHIRK